MNNNWILKSSDRLVDLQNIRGQDAAYCLAQIMSWSTNSEFSASYQEDKITLYAPLHLNRWQDVLDIWQRCKVIITTDDVTINKNGFLLTASDTAVAHDQVILLFINASTMTNKTKFEFLFGHNNSTLRQIKNRMKAIALIDHRHLGKQMELFHFQDEAPGIGFFHPRGFKLWHLIENYMRTVNEQYMCHEIKTPLMAKKVLWERSGHTDKYTDGMYETLEEREKYVIRPMNCPTGCQVFRHMYPSYRQLPVRLSEFGIVHRKEPSGSLHGLFRSRSFMQDDGHIFCTTEHVQSEIELLLQQCRQVYEDFGFSLTNIEVKLATKPSSYIGSDEDWNQAENHLRQALQNSTLPWSLAPNEGAFYGPKIELHVRDSFNRTWQCGTIQLDFGMASKLDVSYVDKQGNKAYPVIIHRAILGSFERFIGILLEHHKGFLPLSFVPQQIVLCSIDSTGSDYILAMDRKLQEHNIRSNCDLREVSLSKKIKEAYNLKIPLIGIVGPRELEKNQVNVRFLHKKDTMLLSCQELIDYINSHKIEVKNYKSKI